MTDESNTDATPQERQDDKSVPLAALEDERRKRQSLETQLAELRGQVQGLSSRPSDSPKQEKVFSAAELRRAVEDGRMSEDEADIIRERQIEGRLRERIESDLTDKLTSKQLADRLGNEFGRYKEAIPGLDDRDSKEFAKLKHEFDHLVSLGYEANDPRTELAAARAAFGDPNKLKRDIKAEPPEAHQETGGSGEDPDRRTNDGAPKGLTPRLREYYRERIDKGFYKGWDDPLLKSELSRVNTGVAKRAQERAA